MSKSFRELRVCKRCGYEWISRKKISFSCPNCQTYKWDDDCWLNDKDFDSKEILEFLKGKSNEQLEQIAKEVTAYVISRM